jgi:16S rRNA processing protein RimM
MKKNFLETGKIVGTHGIRGGVRIQPWCDAPEFLCNFKKLYLDENGNDYLAVTQIKPHGNIVIASFKGVDTIEAAEKFRNRVIYIKRSDVKLERGRYFIDDLIGCKVYDVDSGELLGELSDVSQTGANDVWHIKRGEKEYLIPNIPDVVITVSIDDERVEIRPLKGIFDDED